MGVHGPTSSLFFSLPPPLYVDGIISGSQENVGFHSYLGTSKLEPNLGTAKVYGSRVTNCIDTGAESDNKENNAKVRRKPYVTIFKFLSLSSQDAHLVNAVLSLVLL